MTVPPLLALAEGRKVRPRKATVVRPKEIELHFAVAKVLRQYCRPDWQWFHVPNGELRDYRTAAKLKAMGVRRGIPDLILCPPAGQLHCLELKRLGQRLTEDQAAFEGWCQRGGVPYAIAWTFDEALTVLDAWGCLTIRLTGTAEREGGHG